MRYRFRFIVNDEDIAEFETDANPPSIGDEVVIGPNFILPGKEALSPDRRITFRFCGRVCAGGWCNSNAAKHDVV